MSKTPIIVGYLTSTKVFGPSASEPPSSQPGSIAMEVDEANDTLTFRITYTNGTKKSAVVSLK